ncbi:MAG: FAD-binding oxidoreductase [Telmatospirillum sp.]|nr:FAD-binding oxidoreductase [Telmatospirillum sp.]
MSNDKHLQALAQIVDPRNLILPGSDASGYESGARYDRGRAAFVVRPTDTCQVSAVLAYCARHAIALVPQSGNTSLVSGATPDASGRQGVLSLDRLRSLEIDAGNRSAIAGAGVRLSALNDALRPSGLFFPIDIGADPMIGGMVATNTGGAKFIRYGDVRSNVLGIEVVLADGRGTVLDLLSGLRKNNTGVDLKHLFIGSCGAFGVITRAVLEVHRRPMRAATALLVPNGDDAVAELLSAFEEMAGDQLSAFEGMSGNAMRAAIGHASSVKNPFPLGQIPDYAILVELTSRLDSDDSDTFLNRKLEEVLTALWDRPTKPVVDALLGRGEDLWTMRHAISEGLKALGRQVGFDLSFKRSDLAPFRRHIAAALSQRYPHVLLCDFGHIGDGGVHLNLVVPPSLDMSPGELDALRDFVIGEAVNQFKGSFSAEHGIGRSNQRFYDRHVPVGTRRVVGALGRVLAPTPIGCVQLGYDESERSERV